MLHVIAFTVLLMQSAQTVTPEAKSNQYFHLNFVVKEVEGAKVVNSRIFSTVISTNSDPNASIRSGSKVPVPTGNQGQFTYLELGANIDSDNPKLEGEQVSLHVSADISSVAHDPGSLTQPTIRQNKWSARVVVPLKKPTIIFSSDDLTGKRQMQLELTATPLK